MATPLFDTPPPPRADPPPTSPWWRLPIVWLVIGGPAAVIGAGLCTLWLAVAHPDPVVQDASAADVGNADAYTPARQARNHAQTARPAQR